MSGTILIYAAIGGGLGLAAAVLSGRLLGRRPADPAKWVWMGLMAGVVFSLISGGSIPKGMNESTGNVRKIAATDYEAEVAQSPQPVVIDFYATWCGPCRRMTPIMEKLAGEFATQVKFVKVNVDEAPALAQRFGVSGIPALAMVYQGKSRPLITGLVAEDTLRSQLREFINAPAKGAVAEPGALTPPLMLQ